MSQLRSWLIVGVWSGIVLGLLWWRRTHPDSWLSNLDRRVRETPILFAGCAAAMSALVGLLVANFPRHSASDGVVIGIACFGVTLVMSFRARARETKRGGGHVRLAHGEYQEAQAGAYQSMDQEAEAGTSQSMDIGCLLLTYAFVIAVGVMAVGALVLGLNR